MSQVRGLSEGNANALQDLSWLTLRYCFGQVPRPLPELVGKVRYEPKLI